MLSTRAKLLAASCFRTLDHLLPSKELEGLAQLRLAAAPRLHDPWPYHSHAVTSRAHRAAWTGGRGFAAAAAGDAQTWQNDLGQAMQLIAQGSQDAGRKLLQKGGILPGQVRLDFTTPHDQQARVLVKCPGTSLAGKCDKGLEPDLVIGTSSTACCSQA